MEFERNLGEEGGSFVAGKQVLYFYMCVFARCASECVCVRMYLWATYLTVTNENKFVLYTSIVPSFSLQKETGLAT